MRLPKEVPIRLPIGPTSSPCLVVVKPSAFLEMTA